MPNIASVLKEEICRLAKKEVKLQVGKTQKASAQYRRDIATLKRVLGQQEKEIRLLKKDRHQNLWAQIGVVSSSDVRFLRHDRANE